METTISNGTVTFTEGADQFTVTLHRTLRLPEDGRTHDLPPSMGRFPVKRVDDYADKVPPEWLKHGGVFIPMWQREAMWLQFSARRRPFACKVAAGKINAVSGKEWVKELAPSDPSNSGDPRQDYLVAPPQPWLDGFNAGGGIIRQFVAMPLGQGYTVEGQVTGKEDFGGIQIMALAPKKGLLEPKPRMGGILRSQGFTKSAGPQEYSCTSIKINEGPLSPAAAAAFGEIGEIGEISAAPASASDGGVMDFMGIEQERNTIGRRERRSLPKAAEMGLAQGGSMSQKIYPDPHGIDTWDLDGSGRIFIHIVNSEMYELITGVAPPKSPITARHYTNMGYPWFKLWDDEMGDVSASSTLAGVKTVSQMDQKHGFEGQQDDSPVYEKNVVSAGRPLLVVKDGTW